MKWILLIVIIVAVVAFLLARRGSGGLGANPDEGKPPESHRIPGSGGGNSGGFGA